MTWSQWRNSQAYALLRGLDGQKTKWVYAEYMTNREKSEHSSYKAAGGYLKEIDTSKAYQKWWDRLSGDEKQCIREIPNFDAEKFGMITGINAEDIDVSDLDIQEGF